MTALSALPASAARLADAPSPPPYAPANGRAPLLGGGRAPVALSDLGIKLSNQAAQRSEQVGNRTVDLAQDFINDFARRYLGDGAKVSFDSVDIDTSSNLAARGSHTEGPDGVQDAASFSLNESAHFIGKGKITTADGQSFDFEIEVQYQLSIEASSRRSIGPAPGVGGDPRTNDGDGQLPERLLTPTSFGGDLADLFALLGRELFTNIAPSKEGADDGGNLTLRLLKLVTENKSPEAPAAQDSRTKAVADAYASDSL
jgi:hypothetical protein